MTEETFGRIIQKLPGYVYVGGYGEFTIHPQFAEWVERLHSLAKVNLATNATSISDRVVDALKHVDDLSLSISAMNRELYKTVHGVDMFDVVMRNIDSISKSYSGKICITYVINRLNEPDYKVAEEYFGKRRFVIAPKPMAMHHREAMKDLWVEGGRFDKHGDELRLKKSIAKCREMWDVIYFLANGDVTFCCYDWDGDGVVGNINRNTIDEIWNGECYQALRENHLGGLYHKVCLNQCSLP